jgi:hypothetical protein
LQNGDGNWVDIRESVELSSQISDLDDYELRRANLPNNLSSHWDMARWCVEHALFEQCRAHLHQVLLIDIDNVLAGRALGYVRFGDEWLAPQQVMAIQRRTEQTRRAMMLYGPALWNLGLKFTQASPDSYEDTGRELAALTDPLAVLAVENILASPSPELSQLVIDWLATVDSVEASQAIARYSLFHPDSKVRVMAVLALKGRPVHDYVPDLLEMLSSPVSTMIVPVFDRQGNLSSYRQAFAQEKFDKTHFVVLDRSYARESDNSWSGSMMDAVILNQIVEGQLREQAAAEIAARDRERQRENLQVAYRNARIGSVMAKIAEREFQSAQELWQWWDETNETGYQRSKPTEYNRAALTTTLATYGGVGGEGRGGQECFVAGTPVLTQRGMRAIDHIVAGDLVLSRNVTSGELCWKPVLRATTRPAEATLAIVVGEDRLKCTTGHLFWVSGSGWKKASQLQPGDTLHAAEQPMVVCSVSKQAEQPTFNLEVADNANYFAGQSLVLTHDVTPRESQRHAMPGLALLTSASLKKIPASTR